MTSEYKCAYMIMNYLLDSGFVEIVEPTGTRESIAEMLADQLTYIIPDNWCDDCNILDASKQTREKVYNEGMI